MKNLKHICIGIAAVVMLVTSSCEVAENLDDYKPQYALEADQAIKSEASAELALVGVYSAFRQNSNSSAFPIMYLVPDIMSGYSTNGFASNGRAETIGWSTNNPLSIGASDTKAIYTGLYDLINRSNWLIEKVGELNESVFGTPGRRTQILAESKILRALGHFYLLRNFGQFYNLDSQYGILLRTVPAKSGTVTPRNSVAESYEAILADLNEGIANAPDLRSKKYTNKTFAKGLKARILLYQGKYQQAAALCQEIISSADPNFKLEPTYDAVFDQHDIPAIFTSSEILFGTAGEDNANIGIGSFYSGFSAIITKTYKDMISGSLMVSGQNILIDKGRSAAFIENPRYGGFYTTKYTSSFIDGQYEMNYHMRMAEVYLILAEADARANNAVTEASLQALNTIRIRAGASNSSGDGFVVYPKSISLAQFLTAVRYEKLAELYAEGGETWYDLIRYDRIDGFGTGFKVSDVKPSAINSDKFILPIPLESIDAGGNVIKQNPSY
ncbi:RagB/SusD family nutrient uptake outer membrane protein [Pedobacter agri]|uniref:RagB/SusD family nutrient uptake outer membrane protein n=1 Tax=Pedobacter agri TaxID=454586 RepID=UPI002930432B|nr:RagB/SusD family nutrient uptake outer membrane protein [Pedobacter agri]